MDQETCDEKTIPHTRRQSVTGQEVDAVGSGAARAKEMAEQGFDSSGLECLKEMTSTAYEKAKERTKQMSGASTEVSSGLGNAKDVGQHAIETGKETTVKQGREPPSTFNKGKNKSSAGERLG